MSAFDPKQTLARYVCYRPIARGSALRHAYRMGYRDEADTHRVGEPMRGCKYAFGCALLAVLIFVLTMPFSGLFLWLELNSWGL